MNEHTVREDFLNILRILSSNDSYTQRELSKNLGFSLGKTNYLLKAAIKKGLLKIKSYAKKDEKLNRIKYNLTKKGFEEKLRLTYYFLRRKEKEYLKLKRELKVITTNKNYLSV
jgi:EPS-associated MarR family transcriptional regulator